MVGYNHLILKKIKLHFNSLIKKNNIYFGTYFTYNYLLNYIYIIYSLHNAYLTFYKLF